jgi:hypothetical protein
MKNVSRKTKLIVVSLIRELICNLKWFLLYQRYQGAREQWCFTSIPNIKKIELGL